MLLSLCVQKQRKGVTCRHVATRAKKHVEEDGEERGVETKYWCHGREESEGHACSEEEVQNEPLVHLSLGCQIS